MWIHARDVQLNSTEDFQDTAETVIMARDNRDLRIIRC